MFLLDEEEVIIDEESMREQFEQKMEFILQMKLLSDEELKNGSVMMVSYEKTQ